MCACVLFVMSRAPSYGLCRVGYRSEKWEFAPHSTPPRVIFFAPTPPLRSQNRSWKNSLLRSHLVPIKCVKRTPKLKSSLFSKLGPQIAILKMGSFWGIFRKIVNLSPVVGGGRSGVKRGERSEIWLFFRSTKVGVTFLTPARNF